MRLHIRDVMRSELLNWTIESRHEREGRRTVVKEIVREDARGK